MKSKGLWVTLVMVLLSGSVSAQWSSLGGGLPVGAEPRPTLRPSLRSASPIPLPELSAQNLVLLERATQTSRREHGVEGTAAGVSEDREIQRNVRLIKECLENIHKGEACTDSLVEICTRLLPDIWQRTYNSLDRVLRKEIAERIAMNNPDVATQLGMVAETRTTMEIATGDSSVGSKDTTVLPCTAEESSGTPDSEEKKNLEGSTESKKSECHVVDLANQLVGQVQQIEAGNVDQEVRRDVTKEIEQTLEQLEDDLLKVTDDTEFVKLRFYAFMQLVARYPGQLQQLLKQHDTVYYVIVDLVSQLVEQGQLIKAGNVDQEVRRCIIEYIDWILERLKDNLLKVIGDTEFVSTLADFCGELKVLPQDIVQKIVEALGDRVRAAIANWPLTAENYSFFIDLVALFPEVATKEKVAALKAIIEEAISTKKEDPTKKEDLITLIVPLIDLAALFPEVATMEKVVELKAIVEKARLTKKEDPTKKEDLTKLIVALTELSSLPEDLALMLLDLSNKYAVKFMAELKKGRNFYAFMQLIARYPGQLEQLLKWSDTEVLKKVIDLIDAPEEMDITITEEQLKTFLSCLADNNPAVFVELACLYGWKYINKGKEPHPALVEVLAAHQDLLMNENEDDQIRSVAERDCSVCVHTIDELEKRGRLAASFFGSLEKRLRVLIRRRPSEFVWMLWRGTTGEWGNILLKVACDHPELLIRVKGEEVASLAESQKLVSLLIKHDELIGILVDRFEAGLEFLIEHCPSKFVEMLREWVINSEMYHRPVLGPLYPILIRVARAHPELIIRSVEGNGVKSLAENDQHGFLKLIMICPNVFLNGEQLRKGMIFLAKHDISSCISILRYCSRQFNLTPVVGEKVLREHPEFLIKSGEISGVNSLMETVCSAVVQSFEECPDILNSEELQKGLEEIVRWDSSTIVFMLKACINGNYPRVKQTLLDWVKQHLESFVGLKSSRTQVDQAAYKWLEEHFPEIMDPELGEEPGCSIM